MPKGIKINECQEGDIVVRGSTWNKILDQRDVGQEEKFWIHDSKPYSTINIYNDPVSIVEFGEDELFYLISRVAQAYRDDAI